MGSGIGREGRLEGVRASREVQTGDTVDATYRSGCGEAAEGLTHRGALDGVFGGEGEGEEGDG